MKKHTLKPTKKQLEVMKEYWNLLQDELTQLDFLIGLYENRMRKETNIDDLEFFRSEFGDYCGIGNISKTMKLIQKEDLEK